MFLIGITLTIGTSHVMSFFLARKKLRGTCTFFVGMGLVMYGWPVIGILVEGFGFMNLFWCARSPPHARRRRAGAAGLTRRARPQEFLPDRDELPLAGAVCRGAAGGSDQRGDGGAGQGAGAGGEGARDDADAARRRAGRMTRSPRRRAGALPATGRSDELEGRLECRLGSARDDAAREKEEGGVGWAGAWAGAAEGSGRARLRAERGSMEGGEGGLSGDPCHGCRRLHGQVAACGRKGVQAGGRSNAQPLSVFCRTLPLLIT